MGQEEQDGSLRKIWQYILTGITLVSALATFILQFIAWLQNAQTFRYVSIAPFVVFLVIALWSARKAWRENRAGRLWASLAILLVASCIYAFLWGTWVDISRSGCNIYNLRITAPLNGAEIRSGGTEVRGALRGNPPDGSLVLIVRMPDESHNWPQSAPIQVDPVLGAWRGQVFLGGEPPQEHLIAIAFLGKNGRILVDYFFKVGREAQGWPSLEYLPDDVQICDQITVHRQP